MTLRSLVRLMSLMAVLLQLTHVAEAQDTFHPRFALGGGYSYTRTNLIPGCRCVSMNGGYAQAQFNLSSHWSLIGTGDIAHRGGITQDGFALTQSTYTAGLRWFASTYKARLRPFAEVAGGGAQASGTLAPANSGVGRSNNSYALTAGGGLQLLRGRHLLFEPIEVQYLRTGFANTQANAQNDLHISSGLLFRF